MELEQSLDGQYKVSNKLRVEITNSEATNETLKGEQETYEKSLRKEIERIQKLGPWKRFWGSVELFKNLFEVIQQGFKE